MRIKWFKRALNWIKGQHEKDKLDRLIAYSDVSVKVTAALKKFVDGKIDNLIASQIPGVGDDAFVAMLESLVPKFAFKTALINGILKAGQDDSNPLLSIANHIKELNWEGKEEFYAKFAARLVIDIAKAKEDGVFEFAEVMSISQARFLELKAEGII